MHVIMIVDMMNAFLAIQSTPSSGQSSLWTEKYQSILMNVVGSENIFPPMKSLIMPRAWGRVTKLLLRTKNKISSGY